MRLETEVAAAVYHRVELTVQAFASGDATELNALMADDLESIFYRPWIGEPERMRAADIRAGNQEAAEFYRGKGVRWTISGLQVVPQSERQAAVSFMITHQDGARLLRALVLEVWRKEADECWRIVRWYEEKERLG